MKLAELGVQVNLMSLTPVKRSHSVCAQGGINSVNDQTRQLGDTEWKHFDDTVYGGDFYSTNLQSRRWPNGLPRLSILSTVWASLLIGRPKGFGTVDDLVVPFTSEPLLPAPPRDNSCSIAALCPRRASPPLGIGGTCAELRVLGLSRPDPS